MLRSKPVLRFLILFVLAYCILIATSIVLRKPAGNYLIGMGNKFLEKPINNSQVRFLSIDDVKYDVVIQVANMGQQVGGKFPAYEQKLSSFYFSYMPGALLIALILASPVPGKRKLFSFIVSILILHLILLFRLYVIILYLWTRNLSQEFPNSGKFIYKAIDWLNENFVNSGMIILFIVVFLWLAVTFRKEDLAVLRAK